MSELGNILLTDEEVECDDPFNEDHDLFDKDHDIQKILASCDKDKDFFMEKDNLSQRH